MRKLFTPFLLFLFSFFLNSIKSQGQQPASHVHNMLTAGVKNYTTFTQPNTTNRDEAIKNNPGYENNPEIGELFADAPCDNCYELIGKRTEQSKVFVRSGTNGRDVMQQTSSGAMHYRGPGGEWLTIKSQLKPRAGSKGTFAADEQEAPVVISPEHQYCSLGREGQQLRFNNKLELVVEGPGVVGQSLGKADYSHYTAGDDGVYITDAWPGIDIEMFVARGAIKTNFILKRAMLGISKGSSLVIRDNPELEAGWILQYDGQDNNTGNWEVKNGAGEPVYAVSGVTAYEKADMKNTMQHLRTTYVSGSNLDIHVPADMLHRASSSYPIVIDPLITLATASSVNGSTYSSGWTTGCVYTNPATVPAGVTVTDVEFTFQYVTGGGAVLNNGAYDFRLGSCRSPSVSTLYWNCNSLLTGTCDAVLATIYPQISSCLPAPRCTSYNLDLTMDFYQNYASTAACNPTYIMAGTPLTITVFGHTVESSTVTASASGVCAGQSTVLTAASQYGVSPYSYVWYPGGTTGPTDTVAPATTTTYTVVSTDACGNTTSATKTINVNPAPIISGVTTVCIGGSSTLTASPSGGTWVSANPGIASIGASSGLLSAAAVGTTTVTYTSAAGCSSSTSVTVKPAVAAITGSPVVCQGSTTSLSDPTTSGTWSSANTSVAVVGSSTGFVSGISGGTTTITYSTYGGGCYSTTPVTVNALAPITGSLSLCLGGTTTLSDAVAGGTWSTSSGIISIGASSGIVSGLAIGSAGVTYTTPAGCITTNTVVVNFMNPITGSGTVCQGSTTTLCNVTTGGTWTSTTTSVATIGSASGVVTGVSSGTSLISYSVPGGCFTTKTITVNPISPIAGTPGVCVGGTTTLTDAAGAGTWTSSATGVATIGSATGVLTGLAVGASTISYTSTAGCSAAVTVNITLPTATTGPTSVCQGSSVILSNSTPGGTWTSSNPTVATVGAGTGVVTGVSAGTANITYTNPSGCAVVMPFTVNANLPVTGAGLLCVGTTLTVSSASGGGAWSSGAMGVATVDALTGVVTGIASGTAAITYTTSLGCVNAASVTVTTPSPITGTPDVCQGSSISLSNAVTGGTWSSSDASIASVGAGSGVVTGMTGGTATISYSSAGGCVATTLFTVNPLTSIVGGSSVCAGGSITMSDATPGGVWSSGSTTLATVGSLTGVVTGVSAGTVAINYTTGAGCVTNVLVTVSPTPAPVTGSTLICSTSALSDAIAGGAWTSSDATIASINLVTGMVTGVNPGSVIITYTLPGGCFTTTTLTVDPVGSIAGTTNVCQGSTTILSYGSSGGTWTSLSPSIATVDATGMVTGVSGGTAVVRYTTPTGCVASTNITVFPLAPIVGVTAVCQGSTTSLSDATPGGTWASSTPFVATISATTGFVSGLSVGTATISYTTGSGCTATTTVTVDAYAGISGATSVCSGNTVSLSDAVAGGTWSSANPAIASVDASGMVTGVAAGATTIRYTTAAGCVASQAMLVNANPSPIAGSPTVCQGQTILLTNTLTGGTWTSGSPGVATISSGGIVTGITSGTTNISYTTSAGCYAAMIVTVNPLQVITGPGSVCVGSSITLANATPGGGSWSSTATGIATIDAVTGVMNGVSAGTVTIRFTTPLGCVASVSEVVSPLPSPIGGVPVVCVGSTTILTNTLAGGTWSITNPSVASIASTSGLTTGITADTATVTYTTAAGCFATRIITVNPLPALITGTMSVCAGAGTTLADATPGGTWSSSLPAIASVGATSGLVSGISAGLTTIKYTSTLGCSVSTLFTVNAMPGIIAGSGAVCQGTTVTLSNSLIGGTWSSSAPAIATVAVGTGVVTGLAVGITKITYSSPAGCFVVRNETVNPTPAISTYVAANPTTCVTTDGSVTLSGLTPGATYTVNYLAGTTPVTLTLIADGSGNVKVAGLAAGSYSSFKVVTSSGCVSNVIAGSIVLTLPPVPATPVAGNNTPVCAGVSLQFTATDATPGVTYSWTGPGGFTSTQQNPVLNPSTMAEAGTYTVTATKLGCVSAPATTDAVIHPIPDITSIFFTNPTTCQGSDGTVILGGLLAGVSYTADYSFNGMPQTQTLVADASGAITIAGLTAGTYSNFNVSSFTCLSNTVGPVTLTDPKPPPAPKIESNAPICAGKTLVLDAQNAVGGVTFEWQGPDGFTSDVSSPEIPNVTVADSGLYTLTIRYRNCPTTVSEVIIVHPPVVLHDVTASQPIPIATSIKLHADGADFYLWYPNDGSLSNPNIADPVATPEQNTTYIVEGMNRWGCADSATVSITIDDHVIEGVPGAFTPNNDGLNDVFMVQNVKYDKLVDFSVFNRWGQLVYHNTYDIKQGWDGTFNGVPQEMGTYDYRIVLSDPDGKLKIFKGSVILIR